MSDPYLDASQHVLRNKLGMTHADRLDIAERRLVTQRIAEGAPTGAFDFQHLCAIHRHLFQDVFDWAGEPRSAELTKDGQTFQAPAKIGGAMNAILSDLAAKDCLRGLSPDDFSREAALLVGDVAYVHPFREGSTRALLIFLKQLAEQAGHPLALARVPAEPWIEAMRANMAGDPEPLAALIVFALS